MSSNKKRKRVAQTTSTISKIVVSYRSNQEQQHKILCLNKNYATIGTQLLLWLPLKYHITEVLDIILKFCGPYTIEVYTYSYSHSRSSVCPKYQCAIMWRDRETAWINGILGNSNWSRIRIFLLPNSSVVFFFFIDVMNEWEVPYPLPENLPSVVSSFLTLVHSQFHDPSAATYLKTRKVDFDRSTLRKFLENRTISDFQLILHTVEENLWFTFMEDENEPREFSIVSCEIFLD